MSDLSRSLIAAIVDRRRKAGITQAAAARAAGLSAQYWGQVEAGKPVCGIERIMRMARAVGLGALVVLCPHDELDSLLATLRKFHVLSGADGAHGPAG